MLLHRTKRAVISIKGGYSTYVKSGEITPSQRLINRLHSDYPTNAYASRDFV
jgi:hypothetical protein